MTWKHSRQITATPLFFFLVLTVGAAVQLRADEVKIENKFLRATLSNDGTFSLIDLRNPQHSFATGKLAGGDGALALSQISDSRLGSGSVIILSRGREPLVIGKNSPGGSITLFQDLPFAMIQLTLADTGTEPIILNRVPVTSFSIDLQAPVGDLTTMGTGGLAAPDKNPGSYVWLAVAEPKTRRGVVTAWLTHDRASGVFFPKVENDRVAVEARCDYGHLRILPGKTADTETLAIGYFDDARLGPEQWADAEAKQYQIELPPQPAGYCTWYSDQHRGAGDETGMAELADFAQAKLAPFGFRFLQIDDHWQLGSPQGNGPKKNFAAFDPKGPYPSGMKAVADNIKAHRLMPGLWFMPFAGTHNDPWFADSYRPTPTHLNGRSEPKLRATADPFISGAHHVPINAPNAPLMSDSVAGHRSQAVNLEMGKPCFRKVFEGIGRGRIRTFEGRAIRFTV